MKNETTLDDILDIFEDIVSHEDILYTKASTQVSIAITKERLRLNMNQIEFANHINASQSLVSRWESENYNFTIKKIAEIAAALDMDLDIKMRHKPKMKFDIHYIQAPQTNKKLTINFNSSYQNFNAVTDVFTATKHYNERMSQYVSICK